MIAQLQKDTDDHKIYLVRGKKIPPRSRYCFHCKQGVCYTFLPVDEKETTSIEFRIGRFHQGYKKLVIEAKDDSYFATYYPSPFENMSDKKIILSLEEYKKIVHRVYMSYIKEWDEIYDDPTICDGTSWKIIISRYDYQRKWSGNNAYPPSWSRFIKAINSLDLPTIK